jgi:hypothetical protein
VVSRMKFDAKNSLSLFSISSCEGVQVNRPPNSSQGISLEKGDGGRGNGCRSDPGGGGDDTQGYRGGGRTLHEFI